ncbi:hypothetical protein PSTT_11752 [Puccinia striiformis]|uniref:RING-type domain-containing protein n=1 Tax=Puccinia striiformis TaxID=27350 RepID=A0A2S4UYY7_9BASI|nr:hypothetical protein PSTT_11752 [Puccinia striiformis]
MKLSQSAPRLHRILASTMILILLISRHADSMPPPRLRLSGARGVSRSDEVAAPSRLRPPVTLPMTQRGQEGSQNNGGFISTLSTGPSQGTQVAMKSTPRVLDSADVDGDICVICRDLLDEKGTLALIFPQIPGQDQNYFRTLSGCGHRFHRACVDAWGRKNPTCPICRNADSELEKLREKEMESRLAVSTNEFLVSSVRSTIGGMRVPTLREILFLFFVELLQRLYRFE